MVGLTKIFNSKKLNGRNYVRFIDSGDRLKMITESDWKSYPNKDYVQVLDTIFVPENVENTEDSEEGYSGFRFRFAIDSMDSFPLN